jgi:hypothetical protein
MVASSAAESDDCSAASILFDHEIWQVMITSCAWYLSSHAMYELGSTLPSSSA